MTVTANQPTKFTVDRATWERVAALRHDRERAAAWHSRLVVLERVRDFDRNVLLGVLDALTENEKTWGSPSIRADLVRAMERDRANNALIRAHHEEA